jgi:cytochrome c-type protein NapC
MDTLAALNPKAGNYHLTLKSSKRGCIDCHQGISHAPEESAPLLHPQPVRGRQVTLFYPGNTTRQWLTRDHPGSQPLRQGADCSLCHRGDEAEMGASLGADLSRPFRELGVAFSRMADSVVIDVSWTGSKDDAYLALMWGDDSNTEFRRGGCFAACHDNDQSEPSRLLFHGGEANPEATMGGLTLGAELWRISLATGELETARVGAGVNTRIRPGVTASAHQDGSNWSVRFSVDTRAAGNTRFAADQRYTFGIALHGTENPGREHWVSLPLTLSLSGNSTDFIVE